jgi:hypothetical protein
MVIPELEDLISREQAGTLRAAAEKLRREQENDESGSGPDNVV